MAGARDARESRARVCWCTGVEDVIAGEQTELTLHVQAKPGLHPNFLRPPRVCLQVLRERKGVGSPPAVEFDSTQALIRSAPTMRLRYGPLQRAGPYLLAITIDGSHAAGSLLALPFSRFALR